MPNSVYDVIVIGAGHAGLSVSYFLNKHNLKHVVFERGKVGESWRSQRWDSFAINTPTWINTLPGEKYEGNSPDGFLLRDEFINSLSGYARKFNLPIKENTKVISIEQSSNGSGKFKIAASQNGTTETYFSNYAVIASGIMNAKKVPPLAENVSPEILQLHASEYRNPSQLPGGSVLIVGSGQSGCQISEDLLGAGRKVYLATSKVGRAPRRYRGKDVMYWLKESGFFDVEPENVEDPQMILMKQPQVSGVGALGHTVSLQLLAKGGAVIIGKMESANGSMAYFQPNAAEHVMFADGFSKKIKDMIDEFIKRKDMSVSENEPDEADAPDLTAACASNITELNLTENGITSIIWTTGFGSDFSWIKLPVLDEKGIPIHTKGISDVKGLYFLGFPWLRKRKSGIICGICEDAEFITNQILSSSI